jgi:hypothetical protein
MQMMMTATVTQNGCAASHLRMNAGAVLLMATADVLVRS